MEPLVYSWDSWGMRMNNLFGTIRTLGIAAPASSCDFAKLRSGIKFLKEHGVEVIPGEHLFQKGKFSYLSADDSLRAEDFNALAGNSAVDAILCTRGGYGTPRILEMIDYDLLRERNLPVIGFSDITALHLAMLSRNAGVCVASQMAARLPDASQSSMTLSGMKRVYANLETPGTSFRKVGRSLRALNDGADFSGGVIPLNLTLAAALCGSDFLPSMNGRIIVLEEVGEPVRKVDRMLHQLLYSRFFEGAAGIVFAQFTDCGSTTELKKLFLDFARRVSCPVCSGLAYGHALPSLSFLFDEPCRIENGNLCLTY